MCNDCTIIYFSGDFKERVRKQKALESEMVKKYGKNKPNDFRYKILVGDNCIYAEHITKDKLEEILRKEQELLINT